MAFVLSLYNDFNSLQRFLSASINMPFHIILLFSSISLLLFNKEYVFDKCLPSHAPTSTQYAYLFSSDVDDDKISNIFFMRMAC